MKILFNKIIVFCSTLLIVYAIYTYLSDIKERHSAAFSQKVTAPTEEHSKTTEHPDDPVVAYYAGDYANALSKLKPKAEKDDPIAQFYMGAMFYNGQGVKQDYEVAYMWLTLSKENGNADGQNGLALVKPKMNQTQLTKGDELVKEWRISHKIK